MRQALAQFAALLFLPSPLLAQEVFWAPGTTTEQLGGLVLIGQGDRTTRSLGGILFSRKVKQTTRTPDGPLVTRFVLPSALHSPHNAPLPGLAPAAIEVGMPDPFGIVYIDGQLLPSHGQARRLETQPLPPGQAYPLRVRVAYAVGDRLLIEEKTFLVRAGQSLRLSFDGSRAIAVALPRAETLQPTSLPPTRIP